MEEGAKIEVGSVLKRADVGTLIPEIAPEEMAEGGIVPGAKTLPGKVLTNAAVGTLCKPNALAINIPPDMRTPLVVATSIPY
jgi:hypothetical protein